MTGHKVISGYPEGRRMWLNIKWYDGVNQEPIRIDGEYGPLVDDADVPVMVPNPAGGPDIQVESIIDLHDPNTKIYEVHPAITQEWAKILVDNFPHNATPIGFDRLDNSVTKTLGQLAAQDPGTYEKSFHFVLNNYVAEDNRIPPYQMSYDEALKRNALPVPENQYGLQGGVYEYWDEVSLNPPTGAVSADITLYYQGTSWEYVQFLWLANTTSTGEFLAEEGVNFLDAWLNADETYGATGPMVPPYPMATATWTAGGCNPTPEICTGGIDEDCDGAIDCVDPDCANDTVCQECTLIEFPACFDGLDNDCDGDIDCADRTDCDGVAETCGVGVCESTGSYCMNGTPVEVNCEPLPATEDTEITCNDGLDNDCDGLTDADDPDCQADCTAIMDRNLCRNTPGCEWMGGKNNGTCQYAVACEPTEPGMEMTCNDGLDNDCDGMIDCADIDCDGASNCQVVCTDIPTETECLDAGCMWNRKKGCR
jgi:hypothetical protein